MQAATIATTANAQEQEHSRTEASSIRPQRECKERDGKSKKKKKNKRNRKKARREELKKMEEALRLLWS